MNKNIETAIDDIITLYMQGFPVKIAINTVLEHLEKSEQHEVKGLLKTCSNKWLSSAK